MENTVINRENIQRFPNKTVQAPKPLVTGRTTLGELGNKLHSKQIQNHGLGAKYNAETESQTDLNKRNKKSSKDLGVDTVKEVKGVKNPDENDRHRKEQKSNKDSTFLSQFKHNETIHVRQVTLNKVKKKQKDIEDVASYSTKLLDVVDVDINDSDPLLVSEYVKDIYNYLLELEAKVLIKRDFLSLHSVTQRMRSVLVNWMVEVTVGFDFLLETFHLSVAILDRYLQVDKKISRETLQLVGTTAMLIAGKYEEIYCPEIKDFLYICDDLYTSKQLLQMEKNMIKRLNFDFSRPLSIHFLRRYNKIAGVGPMEHILGKYLLELSLLEYSLCHYKPSLQAAAACCLAKAVLSSDLQHPSHVWTKTMEYYSTYSYLDFKCILLEMASVLFRAGESKYPAVYEKYSSSKFGKITLNPKLKGDFIKKLIEEKSSKYTKSA